ncbi:MAG: acetyl-CoA hydrolase/transferase family protein [Candidatus Binataceae bacterium]
MAQEIDIKDLDLAGIIRPNDGIIWGQGSGEPLPLMEALAAQRHRIGPVSAFAGGVSYANVFTPEHADTIRFTGFGAMGGWIRALARVNALQIIPCHLSQIPDYIANGTIHTDVAFVQVSAPNRKGEYSFGVSCDYVQFAIAKARVVIAEVNEQAPWTHCEGALNEEQFTYMVRTSRPPVQRPPREFGPVEKAIARNVGHYIDDGTTIQIGIGAIPDAIMAGLGDRRDLGLHSGLLSDRVADLMETGVMNNARKPIDTGIATCGQLLGTWRLYNFARENPAIRLFPTTHTHRALVLAQLGRFVAINSAVEIDLTGQINAETAGGRSVGGVGGQVDFVRGAQLASEGRAVIALPSTARDGTISRIVSRLSGAITTARSDADIIVTEYGAAELKGQTIAERMRRMAAISHPDFRAALEREAHEALGRGV